MKTCQVFAAYERDMQGDQSGKPDATGCTRADYDEILP
jgi:hypothetical protein